MIPYKHQLEGVDFLASRDRALLLDEMGLGKTITAILAADFVAGRVLVLVPAVVLYNWEREFGLWAPGLDVQLLDKGTCTVDPDVQVVITTHSLLIRPNIFKQLVQATWDVTIVDEVHNFRTPTAKRTRALYGRTGKTPWKVGANRVSCIVASSRRVWGLTGTLIPNNVSELWVHLWGLTPDRMFDDNGVLITHSRFIARYCLTKETQWGQKIVGNRDLRDLKKRMHGLTLRRLKSEVLDLPPIRFETVSLRPTVLPSKLSLLSSVVLEEMTAVGGLAALKASEEFTRWRRLSGIAKVPPVADLLVQELTDGALDKVVVFAHHKDVIDDLYNRLAPFGAVTITGSTTQVDRRDAIDTFQRDDRCRVVICNILAGGVGVTLHAASEVVFVELSPVPGENAQAADRVHRIGQETDCRVRFVALAGTVDVDIVEILRVKTKMIREAMSA